MVNNLPSSRWEPCSINGPSKTHRKTPMFHFQAPPLWLEAGGLNSISQPTSNRSPLRNKLRSWKWMNDSVNSSTDQTGNHYAISLEFSPSAFDNRRTKMSLPRNNSRGSGDSMFAGKSDIFCSHGWPRRREPTTQEWMRDFTNLCNPRIQKPWLQISAYNRPRPWWWTCWW